MGNTSYTKKTQIIVLLPKKKLVLYLVKAMVFPVDMYGCESCTIKKAEQWRIDDFDCGVGEDS